MLKWLFLEQPSYWSHLFYNVQVFLIGEQRTFSAGFQHSSCAYHVFSNWWLVHAHTRTRTHTHTHIYACMHAHTVLNTKDIYSSTFAHMTLKVKWLQSQNTPFKLALLLVLDYTRFMKLMWKQMAANLECKVIFCHSFHGLMVSYLAVSLIHNGNKLTNGILQKLRFWCKKLIKRVQFFCVMNVVLFR